MKLKYRVIERFREKYSIQAMCDGFEVSRSGYYAWRNRQEKVLKDQWLVDLIIECQRHSKQTYGIRRVRRWIQRHAGKRANLKAILRVMRKLNLLSVVRRRRPYTRYQKAVHKYPNLLNRDFNQLQPNKFWVTDITYIPIPGSMLYMCAVLDLCGKVVLAWKISSDMASSLVTDTIREALKQEKVTDGLALHSDQGSQYTSEAYFDLTQEYHVSPSMSSPGCPYDNAAMENFFGILKTECLWEYLIPSTEEKKNLWDNCVFVFDTNVLLNLYRYTSNTRDTLLAALDNLKERVWLPHQVAFEFAKNRCDVIFETVEKYKGLEKKKQEFVSSIATELRLKTSDEPVVELEKYVEAWLAKQQEKNLLVTQASDDRILDKVLSIFDGKVGTAFTEEEHTKLSEEGKKRYEKQIPPGFCDQKKEKDGHENNEYGDLIVWKQIMLYSASNKVNIIYVTHDQKRDWWNSAKGRTIGPRIELRKEFSDTTGQEFYMYSMDSFLEQYAHHEGLVTDPSVFVEISEIDIQTNRKKRKKQATTLYEYSLVLEKNLENLQERISRRQRTIDNIKMKYQGKALPSEVATQVENTETKMLQLKRQYEHKLIQLENCRRQLLDEEHN